MNRHDVYDVTYDWFISVPQPPRIQAFYQSNITNATYSETFANSNLIIQEGSFLILLCAAFYNIKWSEKKLIDQDLCDELANDTPSRKCLFFPQVRLNDSKTYSCLEESNSDSSLVTLITLNIVSQRDASTFPIINKRSFTNVVTVPPRPIELLIEYECTNSCHPIWIKLPNIIIDGLYNTTTQNFISSTNKNISYVYIETKNLSSTKFMSRLIIPKSYEMPDPDFSGTYRFQLVENKNLTPIDFSLTYKVMPSKYIDFKEVKREEGLDAKYIAKLLWGHIYEIECKSYGFNMSDTNLDFSNLVDSRLCHEKLNFSSIGHRPENGYIVDLNKAANNISFDCGIYGNDTCKTQTYSSTFTLMAKKPGKVVCSYNWPPNALNNFNTELKTFSSLRYDVFNRSDLLTFEGMRIEKSPDSEPPRIGESLTIRCIAPSCEYPLVLEKESTSKKIKYTQYTDRLSNDFENMPNVTVTIETSLSFVIISLTFDNATWYAEGKYACYEYEGYDYENVPVAQKFLLDISLCLSQNDKQTPLSCDIDGQPKSTIEWFYYNQPIDKSDGQLTLLPHKSGEYQCQATNKYGTTKRCFYVNSDGDNEKKSILTSSLVGAACLMALLAASCLAMWLIRKWRLASLRKLHTLMLTPPEQTLPLESFMPVNDQIESLPYDEQIYEIERSKFTMSTVLGSGQFGKVFKGSLKTLNGDLDVAVKVPRDGLLNADHHKSLISELKIMIYVRQHVNVLRVLGACNKGLRNGNIYIITEYCNRGSLKDFLLKNRDKPCSICEYSSASTSEDHLCSYFTVETLLSYAYQAASGMEYLAAKNVIHRDLALRNLLLDGDVVKIADFGLSRHHRDAAYKSQNNDTPLPFFWMALESISSKIFNEKSDVWSFGVVLWEIFSLGDAPYAGIKPDFYFVQGLREGNRLTTPKLAPAETYSLMIQCWNKDPETRPTFSECKRNLGHHLDACSNSAYKSLILTLTTAEAAIDDHHLINGVKQDSSTNEQLDIENPHDERLQAMQSIDQAVIGGEILDFSLLPLATLSGGDNNESSYTNKDNQMSYVPPEMTYSPPEINCL